MISFLDNFLPYSLRIKTIEKKSKNIMRVWDKVEVYFKINY